MPLNRDGSLRRAAAVELWEGEKKGMSEKGEGMVRMGGGGRGEHEDRGGEDERKGGRQRGGWREILTYRWKGSGK